MEDRNDHIDQYFRQALDGVSETPPATVWAALEKRLDGKKRRRGLFWIWLLVGFLAASGLAVFFVQKPAINKPGKPVIADRIKNTAGNQTPPISKVEPQQETEAGSPLKNNTATPTVAKAISSAEISEVSKPRSLSENSKPESKPIISEPQIPDTQAMADPVIEISTPAPTDEITVSAPGAAQPVSELTIKDDLETYMNLEPKAGKNYIPPKTADTALSEKTVLSQPHEEKKTGVAIKEPALQLEEPISNPATKRKFSAGLKTGYEFGTKQYRANSIVISPYLQYFFNSKWGIMTQPAFKYSFTPDAVLLQEAYNKTIDSSITGLLPIIPSGNNPGTSTGKKIVYQKTYDSISIKHFLTNTRQWNVDLPLMLVYRMNKKLELYGGLNMHITRVARIGKQQQTVARITKTDTIEIDPNAGKIDTPELSSVIPNTGIAYSSYQGSAFNNPLINPFKMGVTFGASYAINKRLRFDILYRQTLSRLNYIPNPQVREIYSQPYLRLTLGYKLTK